MSAIIIGGNECMGRTYCDLCAKYNITARMIPLKKGSVHSTSHLYQMVVSYAPVRAGGLQLRHVSKSAVLPGEQLLRGALLGDGSAR